MFKVRGTNSIGEDDRTEEFVGLLAETRINISGFFPPKYHSFVCFNMCSLIFDNTTLVSCRNKNVCIMKAECS
jgi:hypothetical protein